MPSRRIRRCTSARETENGICLPAAANVKPVSKRIWKSRRVTVRALFFFFLSFFSFLLSSLRQDCNVEGLEMRTDAYAGIEYGYRRLITRELFEVGICILKGAGERQNEEP